MHLKVDRNLVERREALQKTLLREFVKQFMIFVIVLVEKILILSKHFLSICLTHLWIKKIEQRFVQNYLVKVEYPNSILVLQMLGQWKVFQRYLQKYLNIIRKIKMVILFLMIRKMKMS